jgi:hypothetical protein
MVLGAFELDYAPVRFLAGIPGMVRGLDSPDSVREIPNPCVCGEWHETYPVLCDIHDSD